jgi:hypothetical protein
MCQHRQKVPDCGMTGRLLSIRGLSKSEIFGEEHGMKERRSDKSII